MLKKSTSFSREVALETSVSGRVGSGLPLHANLPKIFLEMRPPSKMDDVQIIDILPSFSYRALLSLFKLFGTVLLIGLIYD